MHPHGGSDTRARRTGTRGVVERELRLVHLAGDQTMPRTAEALVELLTLSARLLGLRDMETKQAVAELQSVLERSYHLMLDPGADDKRINHGLDRVLAVFVQLDMVAQV